MTDDQIVHAYIKLFRGRGDAVGTWQGGSHRIEVQPRHFGDHLKSTYQDEWIGVYPHLGDRGVSWGCVDIDGKDFQKEDHTDADVLGINWVHDWDRMLTLARNIQAVLDYKHVYAHIERTRNGYHLWVFPEAGIVPAKYMRRALMAACKACDYAPKEVNPKQEELLPGKLGNYVRLPYYGALTYDGEAPDRYFLTTQGNRLSLKVFLAEVKLTTTEALEAVSHLWTPPVVATFDGPPPEELEPVIKTLSGMAYTIWKDGPLEGRDRSNTLAKLAYRMRDDGQSMPNAFAVVKDADRRWGKFADRPDCDEQILHICQRAYTT